LLTFAITVSGEYAISWFIYTVGGGGMVSVGVLSDISVSTGHMVGEYIKLI
jgi:hypothetical protein